MLHACDVMSTNVVAISADTTVEEAIRCLLKHQVTGTPVVDDRGTLVGIISELQLLEAIYRPNVKGEQIRDLMTKDVITVTEDAVLSEVANLFLLHRIRRVPVMRAGTMVGIVTRRDLMASTVGEHVTRSEPTAHVTECSCSS